MTTMTTPCLPCGGQCKGFLVCPTTGQANTVSAEMSARMADAARDTVSHVIERIETIPKFIVDDIRHKAYDIAAVNRRRKKLIEDNRDDIDRATECLINTEKTLAEEEDHLHELCVFLTEHDPRGDCWFKTMDLDSTAVETGLKKKPECSCDSYKVTCPVHGEERYRQS